ncbi:MAG: hypothetical protein ACKVQR_21510 [Aquabacterium sp.]
MTRLPQPAAATASRWLAAVLLAATGTALQGQPADPASALAALDVAGRAIAAAGCPRPLEVRSRYLPDPARPQVRDEMVSTDCRGWRVAVYRPGAVAGSDRPLSVVVEDHHPLLLPPLEVGATEAAVRATLGEPAQRFGANLSYRLPGREADRVTFEIEAGIVRVISFNWSVD